ncbi:hypothetical protein EV714DRAFT_277196 [Schizophyllum commune]
MRDPMPPQHRTIGSQDNPPTQALSRPSIVVSRPPTPSSSASTRGRSQTSVHTRAPSPDGPEVEQATAPTSSEAAQEVAPLSDTARTPSVPESSSQERTKEPSADNAISQMWNAAMAECQERMGVDFLGPEAARFRSEKNVMDYIQLQADSAPNNEDKKWWHKLRHGLVPLARVARIFCDPIADTISDSFPPSKIVFAAVGLIISASIATHEEFEQITDALEEIKVHLQVIEIVAGHRGQLLNDTSVNLLVHIIIVLSVVAQMRRGKYGGRFLKALVEMKPLSDALKDLKQISSRHQEAIIAGTLEVVMNVQASDEMERIMKWLNFDTVDSSQRTSSLLNDRAEGTGLWLFQSPAFLDFMEGQTKVLSIQGHAGCGKSTIIASATRHLRAFGASRESTHVVLAHFFDAANNSGRGTLDSVLSSFLCQLALNDQCCMDMLAQARQRSISNSCFTRQEKLNTLVGMLNGRVHGFLVIDALDEALKDEHAKVLGALRELRLCTDISILVSTRVPLADEDLERDVVSIDRVADNTDIRTALDIEFSDGGRLYGIAKAEMVRNELLMKADGNMRWLTLVIEQLRGAVNDPRRLSRLLEKLPLSLGELYANRLAATSDDIISDIKVLFAWILYSDRPLTTELLSHVLAFNYDARMPTYDPALLSPHPTSQISQLVDSTFVSISEGWVRIAHASVREFLIALSPSSPFYTSSDDAVCLMARTSLAYLLAVVTHIHSTDYDDDLLQLWHQCIFDHGGKHYSALEDDIADVLGEIGASRPPEGILSPALRSAVVQGHQQLVSLLSMNGADGNTVLYGSYDWSDSSLSLADPNITTLHLAAEHGHLVITSLLLERGADIAVRTKWQETPLMIAARNGRNDVVRLLLDHGAGIEDCDENGFTSLHQAARRGHLGTVSFLLARDAHIAGRTEQQDTPLTLAARSGQEDVVRLLLDKGADIEDCNKYGDTSLHQAACRGHLRTVSLLLERGAKVDALNHKHRRSLHHAAQRGSIDIIRLLVDCGATLEASDTGGWTPLYLAVHNSEEEAIELLLSLGSDPRARADDGTTLLDTVGRYRYATKDAERDARIRELLLRAGCTEETERVPLDNGVQPEDSREGEESS